MAVESLEDKISQAGGAVGMLRTAHAGAHPFPVQPQFTTWQDEQKSWHETAVLNHTMVGIPGQEKTGLEIWGPAESGPRVLEALLAAGEQYGLRQGGAIAYSTTALESGWFGLVVPGIYAGDATKAYREWLPAQGFEANASLGGSFTSDDINDYVPTPYDLGYANIIKFDHDFIGADALRRIQAGPHRRKVWLRWNREDVTRLLGDTLYSPEQDRPRYLQIPYAVYATFQYDAIMHAGRVAGISNRTGYTVNVGAWSSLCMIDAELAVDGTEVTVAWGDPQGARLRSAVESPHALREVRAVVSTRPLA